ncbi:MAG: signal peptidase II [Verrucomicrobia bacterium]|nr:signal peptidase II [Verrucomicrobiota bacterium]
MKLLQQDRRIALLAGVVFLLDQLTKLAVVRALEFNGDRMVIPGFFRLVYWGNTGAAWSLFHGNNAILATLAAASLAALVWKRQHFEPHRLPGWLALGFILGGISGNLLDRVRVRHVIDFLFFYVERRGVPPGSADAEAGFPAFNIADTAICAGVALLLFMSLRPAQTQPEPLRA